MGNKSRTDNHNDGQKDRSEGNGYNAPHSHCEEFFAFGEELSQIHDDNGAYGDGWRNADKQAS